MMKDTIYCIIGVGILIGIFTIYGYALIRCEDKGGRLLSGVCVKVKTIQIFGE